MKPDMKNLLVVDDETKILDVVKSFLESKGYGVFTAEKGKDAMEIFARESISLVVLDLMLPDMTGENICMLLRQRSRVPIIMLTAKVEEENVLEGLALGADDYIKKPFSLKELAARIDVLLRRSDEYLLPLYRKSIFNQGDLEVDFERHLIKKKGKEVLLTPNEFKILTALVKYPAKVFTREDLIATCFGDDFEGFDRAVDSHIKNLRQKIEDDSKEPVYILTIRGIGYKFGGQ